MGCGMSVGVQTLAAAASRAVLATARVSITSECSAQVFLLTHQLEFTCDFSPRHPSSAFLQNHCLLNFTLLFG